MQRPSAETSPARSKSLFSYFYRDQSTDLEDDVPTEPLLTMKDPPRDRSSSQAFSDEDDEKAMEEVHALIAKERRVELAKIEEDVNHLSEINQIIAHQTKMQGDKLNGNKILFDECIVHMATGNTNLEEAKDQQDTYRRRMFKLVAGVGATIVLVAGTVTAVSLASKK